MEQKEETEEALQCGSPTTTVSPSLGGKCLICTLDTQPTVGRPIQSETEDESFSVLFSFICKSLKIKLSKKYVWDNVTGTGTGEQLLFCQSCTQFAKELVQIEESIRELERTFQEKLHRLKDVVRESEDAVVVNQSTSPGSRKLSKQLEDGEEDEGETDERWKIFRQQVLYSPKLGRPKKSPKFGADRALPLRSRDSIPKTEMSPTKKSSVSSNSPIKMIVKDEVSDTEPKLRRSRRSKIPKKLKECEAQSCPDLHSEVEESNKDNDRADGEIDEFENGYIPSSVKTDMSDYPTDPELSHDHHVTFSTEVQIKQERPSESEGDILNEKVKRRNRAKACKAKLRGKRKVVERRRSVPTRRYKKIKVITEDEEESASNYETEFGSEGEGRDEDDSSGDDGETDNPESTSHRKWKHDRKAGKMWYDGFEIFPIRGGYKCSKCEEVIEGDHNYKTRGKMKKHILVKHLEKFACIVCNKVTSCQKYLDQHIRMVHEKSVMVPCDICQKPFTSLNAMRRHKWNHQSEEEKQAAIAAGKKQYANGKLRSLQCLQCGKLCKGPYNLRRHEETHMDQKERQKHMCSFCGSIYSAPESLRSHIKQAHENNNQLQWLQCPQCPKKYPQPGLLDKHMRVHTGEKPFVCTECGAGFSQPNLLKVHILKHKNIRPHKCSDCDMAFYRVYHLRRHREVYHESANPPTKKQPYRSENGTRKAPQKRERKIVKNVNHLPNEPTPIPSTETTTTTIQQQNFDPSIMRPDETSIHITLQNTSDQQTSTLETVDGQQIMIGTIGDAEQTFSFVPGGTCAYPFTTYTFTTTTSSELHPDPSNSQQ